MASPILRGGNLVVAEEPAIRDAVRQAILPLWNTYYFFALYANAESYEAAVSRQRARARQVHPGEDPRARGELTTCWTSTTCRQPARSCASTWRC